jgi:hypothetical protein
MGGVCRVVCSGVLALCNGACVDTSGDGQNCGGCGMRCGAGMKCAGGKCATDCAAGLTACGTSCANLDQDTLNCGACGTRCPGPTAGSGSPTCNNRQCGISCSGSLQLCGTRCLNVTNDPNNCKACNMRCPGPTVGSGSPVCNGGLCGISCSGSLSPCGTRCLDLGSDLDNCVTCGNRCPGPTAGSGSATCNNGCGIMCNSGLTLCGTACVDTTTASNCGGCGVACDGNAQCLLQSGVRSCVCKMGYAGNGQSCTPRDECADGTQRCGGLSGTCSNGGGLGYTCSCMNGFSSSGGTFPQCYKSGTYTLGGDRVTGAWAYDFMAGVKKTYNNFEQGDFYVSDGDGFSKFWANNLGEYGLQRVDSTAPLLDVPVPPPPDGYNRFGVDVFQGATYVSRARDPDTKYFIIMRVTSFTQGTGVTFDWVMVYRP